MAAASSKSTKSPAFQFYPRDFFASSKVENMSMTERGIYITFLGRCWLDNGLPTDIPSLAKLARMKAPQFERLWLNGNGDLHKCFFERDGKLHHDRLDHERRVQSEFKKRQSKNGAKGGRPVKPEKPTGNSGLTHPKPTESSAFASASASASVPAVKSAPLIARRRLDAAFEGPRVYVPQRVHQDFLGLRNHDGADRELFAWYEQVSDAWTTGAHAKDSPGADMIRFWKSRYDERWPAAVPARVDARRPSWAV